MSISPNTLNLLETKGIQANAVIEQLEQIFPPVNPAPTDDLATIMYRAGQRSVVEWIIENMD
jgi:hypothetical protein